MCEQCHEAVQTTSTSTNFTRLLTHHLHQLSSEHRSAKQPQVRLASHLMHLQVYTACCTLPPSGQDLRLSTTHHQSPRRPRMCASPRPPCMFSQTTRPTTVPEVAVCKPKLQFDPQHVLNNSVLADKPHNQHTKIFQSQ